MVGQFGTMMKVLNPIGYISDLTLTVKTPNQSYRNKKSGENMSQEEKIKKEILKKILSLPQFSRRFSVEGRSGDSEGVLVEHGIEQIKDGKTGSYFSIKQVLAVLDVGTITCDNCGDIYGKGGEAKFDEIIWIVFDGIKYGFCCEGCKNNYFLYRQSKGVKGEGCTRKDHFHMYKFKKERKWYLC